MISLDLARALRAAGLDWTPAAGDRFIVPDRGMDDEVFVISDMAIEVHEHAAGREIGFNGTTEWALDSVQQQAVVWLPRETQLRELLGESFVRLERGAGGYLVETVQDGTSALHCDAEVESAYARAVLAQLA